MQSPRIQIVFRAVAGRWLNSKLCIPLTGPWRIAIRATAHGISMSQFRSMAVLEQVSWKWQELAERRRAHLVELFHSGRWKRYFTEQQFLHRLRDAIQASERWAEIASALNSAQAPQSEPARAPPRGRLTPPSVQRCDRNWEGAGRIAALVHRAFPDPLARSVMEVLMVPVHIHRDHCQMQRFSKSNTP